MCPYLILLYLVSSFLNMYRIRSLIGFGASLGGNKPLSINASYNFSSWIFFFIASSIPVASFFSLTFNVIYGSMENPIYVILSIS